MTFSIVIPVYNAEKYIEGCISSVFSHNNGVGTDYDIEVLLIENGSTDSSAAICDKAAAGNDKVQVFHFGKIGAFAARREGMRAAKGDYIVFSDADDLMAEGALDSLSEYVSDLWKKGMFPDIVLYNAADYDHRHGKMFDFPFEENRIYEGDDKQQFFEIMCSNDSLNALWNKCISKDLADACLKDDGKGKGLFNHGEDLLQTAEFLDRTRSIAYFDKILYYYRENTEGLTGRYHKEFLTNQEEAWKAFDEYAVKWTGDGFKEVIDRRKTLTCMICAEKLISSNVGLGVMKKELRNMLDSDFFKAYGNGMLPDWAPESSIYIMNLLQTDDPYKTLCKEGAKHRFKQAVKRLLLR